MFQQVQTTQVTPNPICLNCYFSVRQLFLLHVILFLLFSNKHQQIQQRSITEAINTI